MKNLKNLSKLPKRKVTIDNLLQTDTINHVIDILQQAKSDIESLVVIAIGSKGLLVLDNGLAAERKVMMLEDAKFCTLLALRGSVPIGGQDAGKDKKG